MSDFVSYVLLHFFVSDSEYGEDDYGDEDDTGDDDSRDDTGFADIPLTVVRKKSGGRSSKIKILLPPPEEFEPINFTLENTDLTMESVSGDVTISGYWIRDGILQLPQAVCMSVAGVMVTPYDYSGAGDKRAYLKAFQDRIDDTLAQSVSAEGIIYGTFNEALEFSRRFNTLLSRHVRMTEAEFTQVSSPTHAH